VTEVDEGSWAALAGLAEGDIIRSIDGVAVKDMEAARARLREFGKSAFAAHRVLRVARRAHSVCRIANRLVAAARARCQNCATEIISHGNTRSATERNE
jgi:S1-C subfamily serine protease